MKDLSDILAVYNYSLRELDEEDPIWFQTLLESKPKNIVLLVATVGNKVAGFLLGYLNKKESYIEALAVHPRYRGLGLGSSLLKAFENKAKGAGTKKIELSVKSGNINALGFYLKQKYSIKGVVLLLSLDLNKVKFLQNTEFKVRLIDSDKAAKLRARIKAKPSVWWSLITEEADSQIYSKIRNEKILAVYKKRKFKGLMEFEPDTITVIDYLALPYQCPREALSALLEGLKICSHKWKIKSIVIPVDSTKEAFISTLINTGFKVTGIEYRLVKRLK